MLKHSSVSKRSKAGKLLSLRRKCSSCEGSTAGWRNQCNTIATVGVGSRWGVEVDHAREAFCWCARTRYGFYVALSMRTIQTACLDDNPHNLGFMVVWRFS